MFLNLFLPPTLHDRLNMESPKAESEMEFPKPASPCWKKEPEAGLLANVKDHFEQFVTTSMDEHRICLKKTIQDLREYIKRKKQNNVLPSSRVASESDSAVTQTESSSRVQVATS
ncbi:hypothetical protein Cni_G07157 [Canna indica]|uniref:Uncharacterized protein n=1 Tax=Canna indica TaxID=4628 RepID=A0AAQ3Q4N3_9LILI|nr:hypothetical protein Cni_G07157 [Canna indica]